MVSHETLVVLDSPIGQIGFLGDEQALLGVLLPGMPLGKPTVRPSGPALDASVQMAEFLAGKRQGFDVPLATDGTPFQRQVWAALETIPYGEVRTYGQIADLIDRPAAARPVGQAVGRNPHPIVRPCHRVVAAEGIGGYDGRLDTKRALLEREGTLAIAETGSSLLLR